MPHEKIKYGGCIMTKVKFIPGTYKTRATGHNGSLPMEVELSEKRIEAIRIDTSGESKELLIQFLNAFQNLLLRDKH